MRLQGEEVEEVPQFKFRGSSIQSNEERWRSEGRQGGVGGEKCLE